MNYFTFLEHIDKPDELIRLTALPSEEDPVVPLRMHPIDFSRQNIHDDSFWNTVSDTFRSLPFTKRVEKPIGHWKRRQIDYGHYKDNQSIEHLPYYTHAPYYNSAHGYDPSRYFPQMHAPLQHYEQYDYDMRHVYHVPMVAMPQMMPVQHVPMQQNTNQEPVEHFLHSLDSASGSRKRSNSSRSDLSEYGMLDKGLQDLRNANRKIPRTSRDSPRHGSRESRTSRHSEYNTRELREMIMEDVRRERKERRQRKKSQKKRRHRYEESSESSSSEEERCREDSGREDNGHRRAPSIASTNSTFESPQRYPTYDELVEQIKSMEREKEEQMQIAQALERRQSSKRQGNRWKTESSDSDEF